MAVFINFGGIKIAAQSNNAGVWFGQNIQNGWDAHAVTKVASAFNMGDFNILPTFLGVYIDPDLIDSPIADQDIKGNATINIQGI
jgi:hypothetical protein